MKKLLSVVAVAAIVTSAFAFSTNKVATFCVFDATLNNCKVINQFKIVNGVPNFKHYPLAAGQWDGTAANCTGIANCSVDIRLVAN